MNVSNLQACIAINSSRIFDIEHGIFDETDPVYISMYKRRLAKAVRLQKELKREMAEQRLYVRIWQLEQKLTGHGVVLADHMSFDKYCNSTPAEDYEFLKFVADIELPKKVDSRLK